MATPSRLFVVWRESTSRAQYRIGELSYDGARYLFRYDLDGVRLAQRHGLSILELPLGRVFPHIDQEYESTELFSVFAHRLPDRRRPDYERLLARFDLTPSSHVFEVLRKTRGRLATDQLSLEEAPLFVPHGLRVECFVAGWQFYEGESVLGKLQPGTRLRLHRDKHNKHDPNAVIVLGPEAEKLGYIPVFHSELVARALSAGRRVEAYVVGVSPSPTPSTDRLKISVEIFTRRGLDEIRERLRENFRLQALPRSMPGPPNGVDLEGHETIIIGPAPGRVCAACELEIDSAQNLAIEFRYPNRIVWLHHDCFDIWNEVRRESVIQLRP